MNMPDLSEAINQCRAKAKEIRRNAMKPHQDILLEEVLLHLDRAYDASIQAGKNLGELQ